MAVLRKRGVDILGGRRQMPEGCGAPFLKLLGESSKLNRTGMALFKSGLNNAKQQVNTSP